MSKKLPSQDQKKSVLIVSQYFWPEEFRVNELSASFQEKGYDVTVLTGKPNYPQGYVDNEYEKNPKSFDNFHGVKILRVPLRPRKFGQLNLVLNYFSFIFWASTLGIWLIRGKKFDSIFVFATSPITVAIPAIFIKKIKKIPMTVWILDLWPETLSSLQILKKGNLFYRVIENITKWIYKESDLILIQSEAFGPSVQMLNTFNRPIHFFPQWVEKCYQEKQNRVTLDIPNDLKKMNDKFIVLFAGNMGAGQDFPSVLDTVEILKHDHDIEWVIVGDGRLFDWVNNEIKQRGLTKNIKLLGRFPSKEMPKFFAAASALLVTLRPDEVYEKTIPGKLQSYLISGKPILGMLDGEGNRILTLSGGGMVANSGDSRKLALNVLKLKNMSISSRLEFGKSGFEFAMANFKKEDVVSKMLTKMPFKSS